MSIQQLTGITTIDPIALQLKIANLPKKTEGVCAACASRGGSMSGGRHTSRWFYHEECLDAVDYAKQQIIAGIDVVWGADGNYQLIKLS